MAKSRNGQRYTIGIALGVPDGEGHSGKYQVYNDSAILKFMMDIPLNGLPTGRATITGPANGTFPVSGGYGYLGLGAPNGEGDAQVPIYVSETYNRQILSANVIAMDITFIMGTSDMHAIMPATAVTGNSTEAISEILSIAGIGAANLIRKKNEADIMTWRLVEGTLEDHLKDIVEHSTIPGDIMYWAFDDMVRTFVVGSFNSSYDSKMKNCLISSTNSIQPSSAAFYYPKGCNAIVWPYSTYEPQDTTGSRREFRKPNIFMDSTGPEGSKDTGRCNDISWFNLVMENGAEPVFMDGPGFFGPLKVVKPYPMNTHKMYSIAPLIREYLMSSYRRMVTTDVYNHPGPPVGSCVYFCASSTDNKMGNMVPDPRFTARYIVTHKRIIKDATTSEGLLGTTKHTQSSELVSEITMMAKNDYLEEKSPEYEAVIQLYSDITQNMQTATEKK